MTPPRFPPINRRRSLRLLEYLLRRPTAPFHEHHVRAALEAQLTKLAVPHRLDAHGNLLARLRQGRAAPLAMLAHMDHPGFEIRSCSAGRAIAEWEGQIPPFDLRGLRTAVWPSSPGAPRRGDGEVLRVQGKRLTLSVPPGTRSGDFGYAHLAPFRLSGGRIVSKCLDNVGGCGAILACLDHLVRHRMAADLTVLFTRAEEGGFHGTFAAVKSRVLPRTRPLVVLECSKAMPGAEMGSGPVIRIGDRLSVFDPRASAALERTAALLTRSRRSFVFQRRLMDGGACEASVFGVNGYPAVCLAFPLGNYHNIGSTGVRPEFISREDFLNGVDLIAAHTTAGIRPAAAWAQRRRNLQSRSIAAQHRRLRRTKHADT